MGMLLVIAIVGLIGALLWLCFLMGYRDSLDARRRLYEDQLTNVYKMAGYYVKDREDRQS